MAKKYLDETGLAYFWGKLKSYFQVKLVSGTNIKTINNESVLGSGNISISSGGGGEEWYDFTTTFTPSIDSRGVSGLTYAVVPVNGSDITESNLIKVGAYLHPSGSNTYFYPLAISQCLVSSTVISSEMRRTGVFTLKCIAGSTQSASSTTVSGTLHFVAPFEIYNVLSWK